MSGGLLALDASSTSIGWVYWPDDALRPVARGTIILQAPGKKNKRRLGLRVRDAQREVGRLVDQYQPTRIGREGPAYNGSTSLVVQSIVAGGIYLAVLDYRPDMDIEEYSPTTIKKILTDNGGALKDEMIEAAGSYLHDPDEHQADALGVALAMREEQSIYARSSAAAKSAAKPAKRPRRAAPSSQPAT